MEELEETCHRYGYWIYTINNADMPFGALIFEIDGGIIINSTFITDKAASNISAWVADNPYKPQPRKENGKEQTQ